MIKDYQEVMKLRRSGYLTKNVPGQYWEAIQAVA
jgi:hypothetical protein